MERIHYVIIGTGINVNIKAQDFPEELRDKAASFLQVKGETIPRAAFFRAVLEHMDALYDAILREGFSEVFSEWRRYSITLGQMVRVIDARGGGQEAFVARPSTSMMTAHCSSIRQRGAAASSRATFHPPAAGLRQSIYNRRIIFVTSSRYWQHEHCHGYL